MSPGRLLCALLPALLGACTVGPDFVRPAAAAADRYTAEPPAAASADGQTQHFVPGAAIAADWWRLFQSPALNELVQRALANNPSLQAAEASLRQSEDNLRAGNGVFYPQLSASLNGSRQRTAPVEQGLKTSGSLFNLTTLGGTVSYAFDVFGGERRMVEGLQAAADYQAQARQAAYLTLTANVVNTAIARAAYQAEQRATEQILALQQDQLKTTQAQYQAGLVPYSNVLAVSSLIAANQAALAPLQQRISQSEHLLASLQGVPPTEVKLTDFALSSLTLPADLPLSLPSALVRQRPDILAAEASMHGASANIGVATAAMYPSFELNAGYGLAGTSLGNLPAANGKFWSVGPALSLPLFQGGRLWFGRQAAIDAYQQTQATYRQTVLAAFAQVADSLQALQHDAQALAAQSQARQTAAAALALLQANYRAGLASYLDVLSADVQLEQTTIAYVQALAQRQQDTVALFVALGGGWWNSPPAREAAE